MMQANRTLELTVDAGRFAVCRLDPGAAVPKWCATAGFTSVTRTADELSIVCEARLVPPDVRAESGWSCLAVTGPLEFSEVGVLASICVPLAQAGISLFAVSTFNTDHVLVREDELGEAIKVLERVGHHVRRRVRTLPS